MLYFWQEKRYHTLVQQYIEQHTSYHYKEILGIGGYGVAYLIEDKHTKQQYVLKRLKAKHKRKASTKQKFQLETELLKSLNNPYFPQLITAGQIKNIPFYIMEYISGYTFEQAIFLEGKQFTISETLQITQRLLEIVIYMHHQGIVHRDLRIPNILIQENSLRVIDFGLATYINPGVQLAHIKNPKKAENYISDLYFVGHFLLFLLYSQYTPTKKRERSWQEELKLPVELTIYIERLLLIQQPFNSAEDAYNSIPYLQ